MTYAATGNKLYPLWKQELLKGTANMDLNHTGADGVFAVLIDGDTVGYNAAHQYYSSISAGAGGTPMEISPSSGKSFTGGVFDGDDVTFTAVAGTVSYEAIAIFRKVNGQTSTGWPLVAWLDTSVTNLPVTSNGGDISITWNASGLFAL